MMCDIRVFYPKHWFAHPSTNYRMEKSRLSHCFFSCDIQNLIAGDQMPENGHVDNQAETKPNSESWLLSPQMSLL